MGFDFAEINGTQIHYEIRGEGTAVTLIHAELANLSMWDDQMVALSKTYRVLRHDVRGGGQTTQPDMAFNHEEDLRALLTYVGVTKTAVIGCSWGGKIALDFALTYPEMVSALVLVGPALGGFPRTSTGFVENEAVMEGVGERREMAPPARTRLAEVTAPTLVLVGEHDVPDIHTIGEILAAELPLVEKVRLPHTAHLPNMERPQLFSQLVLDFLEKATWRSTIYAILPHETEAQVWLEPTAAGLALPHVTMAGAKWWDTDEADVQRPLQRLLGTNIQVLYRAHFQIDETQKTGASVVVLDNGGVKMVNGRWVSRQELPFLTLAQPTHQPLIEQCLREWVTGDTPPLRPPWARRGWFQQAAAWIESQLAQAGQPLIGPLEPVRQWSLSCVLRANTAVGCFYFKTVAALPLFVNEANMTIKLGQLYPHHLLTPLAVDRERDWMLLPELTQIVGWDAPLAQRLGFLRQFGQLQKTAVADVAELLAAGCLDRRMEWLAAQIEPLLTAAFVQPYLTTVEREQLRALIPRLHELCQELADFAIPQTLVHGDLHGGNVAIRGEAFVYYDWTDACISHPFFDMLIIFMEQETAVQTQLRDAYLSLWLDFEPLPRLLSAWSLAEVLGALHHAISYWQIVAAIEAPNRHELEDMLPKFLRKVLTLTANLEFNQGV